MDDTNFFSLTPALIILCTLKTRLKMDTSSTEKIYFIFFMAIAIGWRIWETFRKQGTARGQASMLWSFYALFASSCIVFGGTVLEFFFVPRTYHTWSVVVGTILFIGANWMRMVAIRTLGRFWSLHIEMRTEHEFVQTGIYSHVRHPAYLSFVLEHIAVPLVGNAWWALLAALMIYLPLLLWRIRREDAALVEKFGEPYRVYQQEISALIPRWRHPQKAT
jgi:protein-S-isoprenylcysteine O-methyltransferase Ste14